MDNKKIKAQTDILRALGMIDGASCAIENAAAGDMIGRAIEIIENALEELMK